MISKSRTSMVHGEQQNNGALHDVNRSTWGLECTETLDGTPRRVRPGIIRTQGCHLSVVMVDNRCDDMTCDVVVVVKGYKCIYVGLHCPGSRRDFKYITQLYSSTHPALLARLLRRVRGQT
jgi:hypothetical protein